MAVDAADNSLINNARSWDELKRLASTEQAGDYILSIRKFGRSASLTANIVEDVWESGGTKILLTSAETMDIVSTSTDDDNGGTGANIIQVGGLDSDYNLITDTIIMDGTTTVTSNLSFLRVNRVRAVFCGTGKTNAGTITVTSSTSSAIQATIPAGESISQQSHFTIPSGYTAFTTGIVLSVYRASGGSGNKAAEITTSVYVPAANTTYKTLRYGVSRDGGPLITVPNTPSQTPEKCTVWFDAVAESTGTVVTSSQEFILIKGDYNLRTEI